METCKLVCFVSPKTIGPLISDGGVKGNYSYLWPRVAFIKVV